MVDYQTILAYVDDDDDDDVDVVLPGNHANCIEHANRKNVMCEWLLEFDE